MSKEWKSFFRRAIMAETPLGMPTDAVDTRATRSRQGCKMPTPGIRQAGCMDQAGQLNVLMRAWQRGQSSIFARIYRSATEFAERCSLPCDAPTGQSYRAPRALIAWVFRLCWAVCHAWIYAIHLFLGRAVDTLSLPKWARRWIRSTVAYSQLFVCCFYVGQDRRCA